MHMAIQGTRVDPWSRKIPHATELSLCTTAAEPVLHKRSPHNEKCTHTTNREEPLLVITREKPIQQ